MARVCHLIADITSSYPQIEDHPTTLGVHVVSTWSLQPLLAFYTGITITNYRSHTLAENSSLTGDRTSVASHCTSSKQYGLNLVAMGLRHKYRYKYFLKHFSSFLCHQKFKVYQYQELCNKHMFVIIVS